MKKAVVTSAEVADADGELDNGELLTLREVAESVDVSTKAVLRRIERGTLRATRQESPYGPGFRYLVRWGEVLAWVIRGEP